MNQTAMMLWLDEHLSIVKSEDLPKNVLQDDKFSSKSVDLPRKVVFWCFC